MQLDTVSDQGWKPVLDANYSTNGYPTKIPTTTPPAMPGVHKTGIIRCGDGGALSPTSIQLLPYGTDASTHTFSFTVLGWAPTLFAETTLGTVPLWIPVQLAIFQATLGTAAGIAGSDLVVAQQFATTITQSYGNVYGTAPTQSGDYTATGGAAIFTPGGNIIGMVEVLTRGFPLIEVIFTTGGVVTDCNALWRKK